MNQTKDEQIEILAGKIRLSDKDAFDDFFRLMYPQLVRFAGSYVRDASLAGDVVQDVFVNLWQKRELIDPGQSLKSYLYKMVRNQCLNELRDRSKEMISTELTQLQISENEVHLNNQKEEFQQFEDTLHSWISNLPGRQREALELSRFDGLDHNEIADVMDVSVKTVNNHIVAALSKLRDHYQQYKKEQNK